MSRPRDDRASASGGRAAPIVSPQAGGVRADSIFTRLKWTSFTHSCIYAALLVCAFAAGKPEPATFVLGLTHGVLWILMSLVCIACVRLRIVPLRLAAAVAVLGGIGPFFGSFEFVREQRHRDAASDRSSPTAGMTVKPCEGQVKHPSHDPLRPPAALE
ncbi:MAG: hypothetical protein ACHQE6_09610 [Solirubrobacterales bacterium]